MSYTMAENEMIELLKKLAIIKTLDGGDCRVRGCGNCIFHMKKSITISSSDGEMSSTRCAALVLHDIKKNL